MKLVLHSLMIFFGTLMAAAVVALGEPGPAPLSPAAGQAAAAMTADER
jgi:hypothetical protein